jgi:hypothetical protein
MASAAFTFEKQTSIEAYYNVVFPKEKWLWNGAVFFQRWPVRYWGIGTDTKEEDEIMIDYRNIAFEQSLYKRMDKGIYVGPKVHFRHMYDVNFKSVENALRKEGFYPDVARLITRLCTKEGAIPQGCPTSSFLASLVVYHSCDDLFEKYQLEGLKVSIYVDDITFSSPSDFKPKTNGILEELRNRGLKINFDKTHYCTKNPRVTGIQVKNNGICPLPHTFERSVDLTIKEAS